MTIPSDHLRACAEHGVVAPDYDGTRRCPVCETDVEARPDAVADTEFIDTDMRLQVEPDTMAELLPLLAEDAGIQAIGPVYVAVAELSVSEVRNAAGWTEQERFFNVAVAELGHGEREIIAREGDARDAIDTIKAGEDYLEPATVSDDALEPENWKGAVEPYAGSVEYARVDDDTLHVEMSGFPSDSAYSDARRELGVLADMRNVSIRTVDAGGRFEDATVALYVDGGSS